MRSVARGGRMDTMSRHSAEFLGPEAAPWLRLPSRRAHGYNPATVPSKGAPGETRGRREQD